MLPIMELVVIRRNIDHSWTHSIYSEDQIERPPLYINVELYHISLQEAVRQLFVLSEYQFHQLFRVWHWSTPL